MSVRFNNPPINEAVLSAQFAPLHGMTGAHVGAIWGRFRSRFPKLQEHDPIANAVERFGEKPSRPQVQFLIGRGQPLRRTWFVGSNEHELIQVQPDRFVRNWRRIEDRGDYPGFAAMRADFEKDLDTFEGAVADEELGELSYDQCELTYIDLLEDGFQTHADLGNILRGVSWPALPHGIEAERLTTRASFVLRDTDEPVARIHVNASPAHRLRDGKPLFRLETTARGEPLGSGQEGVLAFIDRVHQPVLDLFLALTTDEIQTHWGLQRDA